MTEPASDAPEKVEKDTVTFLGEKFTVRDGGPSEYRLARFGAAVIRAEEGNLLNNIAEPLLFVEACLDPSDLGRFHALADAKNATMDAIQDVIGQLWGTKTDRPTERPDDSTSGPQTTGPKSTSNADDKGSGRFDGRPDLRKHLRLARDAEQKAS